MAKSAKNKRVQKDEIILQRTRLLNRYNHPAKYAPFEDVYATIDSICDWLLEHDSGFSPWFNKHKPLYMLYFMFWETPNAKR